MTKNYIKDWKLTPDGPQIVTANARLFPVIHAGQSLMLKIASSPEEKAGAALMSWWDGVGAARVLKYDEDAILMERAEEELILAKLSREGADNKAILIMCEVISKLHGSENKSGVNPLPKLHPLHQWFRQLLLSANHDNAILSRAAETAKKLLEMPFEPTVLHGDIHHDNVLYFGERGWLAIDPKGLIGNRAFDYANIFCNPDYETATEPDVFQRRLHVISATGKIERKLLLEWILAWAGLSAIWDINSGFSPVTPLRIAELANAELAAI
ncbi:MAG: aminoglycoside phosphotransferase family protein [Methyloligellaceae bacterium]